MPSSNFSTAEPAKFRLRPLAEADLERVRGWRNSERIRAAMFSDGIISAEQQRAWYQRVCSSRTDFYFVFEVNGSPVGLVYFTQVDSVAGTAHWGFYVGDLNAPAGTGSIMCFFGLDRAFDALKFRRIIGEVLVENTKSATLHERLGFIREGCWRKHAVKNGSYHDVIAYGLLREEWLSQREKVGSAVFRGDWKVDGQRYCCTS